MMNKERVRYEDLDADATRREEGARETALFRAASFASDDCAGPNVFIFRNNHTHSSKLPTQYSTLLTTQASARCAAQDVPSSSRQPRCRSLISSLHLKHQNAAA